MTYSPALDMYARVKTILKTVVGVEKPLSQLEKTKYLKVFLNKT